MEEKSKSARKRELEALQNLAITMSKLSESQLTKLNLPEPLHEAIREYRKIGKSRSFGALKRQGKYLGRLMREADPELIEKLNATVRQNKS